MDVNKAFLIAISEDNPEGLTDVITEDNVNQPLLISMAPFLLACNSGSMNCLKYFISQNCDVSIKGILGTNALMQAALCQKIEVVRYIAERNPEMLGQTDDAGRSVLNYAAETGYLPIIKLLMEKYGNMLAESKENPIYSASSRNHIEAVKYIASKHRYSDILTRLVKFDELTREILEALIGASIDFSVKDEHGKICLDYAGSISDF